MIRKIAHTFTDCAEMMYLGLGVLVAFGVTAIAILFVMFYGLLIALFQNTWALVILGLLAFFLWH